MNDFSNMQPVLQLVELHRAFRQGENSISVLNGISNTLYAGQAVALVGPSGSGKSTLLHISGLLETPDHGQVIVQGQDCSQMNDKQRTCVRRALLGFIYQFHQLLPEFSALENVVIPQMIQGKSRRVAAAHARELLEILGLGARADHRPAELSGGEQQRVAIARGLANSPSLILADEPTGNLDPDTTERVFEDLMKLIEYTGVAALIATHNLGLAHRMHRVLQLSSGRIIELKTRY
ncbi:MAG TPA: Lipoprotein-releasing system ATP-binding protein LolD [Hyphomicrobiaceae bacterium MAG_BT-2024]